MGGGDAWRDGSARGSAVIFVAVAVAMLGAAVLREAVAVGGGDAWRGSVARGSAVAVAVGMRGCESGEDGC